MTRPDSTTTHLVLVGGQLCTPRFWDEQRKGLARRAELHDFCPGEAPGERSVADAARRLLATAPTRFAIAGHALGGFIALEVVRQAPGRVTHLALLGTNAEPDAPSAYARRMAYKRLAEAGQLEELIAERYAAVLHPALAAEPRYRDIVATMARATGAERFLRQQDIVLGRPDSRPSLGAIRCPCVLIVGREDRLGTVAQHEEIARGIAQARLHVIEDCGHFSPLEKPAEVTALLLEWLTSGHPA